MAKSGAWIENRGIASIATTLWFHAIQYHCGAHSPYKLAHIFGPNNSRDLPRISYRQWCKYRNGSPTPTEERVYAIEKQLPGTAQWLMHPCWQMLNYETHSFIEMNELLASLGNGVPKILLHLEEWPEIDLTIIRRKPFKPEVISKLWKCNSLDALAAFHLLMSDIIEFGFDSNYMFARGGALDQIDKLTKRPELQTVPVEVFERLELFIISAPAKLLVHHNYSHHQDGKRKALTKRVLKQKNSFNYEEALAAYKDFNG